MSVLGVRRGKAAFFSGCKSHLAIAPAGSNRSSHGGAEMAEAFGIACHALVSLDFRCGSTTEVSDGHENVRSWVTSGSRIWAAGGLLVANTGSGQSGRHRHSDVEIRRGQHTNQFRI